MTSARSIFGLNPVVADVDELFDHLAVAVDDVGFRKLDGAVAGGDFFVGIAGGLETIRGAIQEILVALVVLIRR